MAQMIAINGGAHTVFDAQVRVADLECFDKSKTSKGAIPLESCYTILRVTNVITPNHSAGTIGQLSLAEGNVRRFNIFWTARNGDWIQYLRLVKVDGNWRSAIRVFRGEKVLFKDIPPDVPQEVLGPDWIAAQSRQEVAAKAG